MTPRQFTIDGIVERCDAEMNGTTRPTWRARVRITPLGASRKALHGAIGEGKAAHVALNRACTEALQKAMTPLDTMRARDWLRLHDIGFRDALLLECGDGEICAVARQYLVRITCPGDIQRERDAALRRTA